MASGWEAIAMGSIALLSFLAGALLGLRANVLVLVPALGIALPLVALICIARGETVGSLIVDMAVTAACVEAGYIATLVARALVDAARAGETPCRFPVSNRRQLRDTPPAGPATSGIVAASRGQAFPEDAPAIAPADAPDLRHLGDRSKFFRSGIR
jgi:hypothetical protein